MNKAYKFRIYPNSGQSVLLAKTFGCVRLVYNYYLERKITQYQLDKSTVNYTQCASEMAQLKKTEAYGFLKEVDSIALQQSLRHLDAAFQNFFRSPKVGFPKFKSKRNSRRSYTTQCVKDNITIEDGYIKLPKVGLVKLKQHRDMLSGYTLKSVTVSQTPGGEYYASVLFEYENQVQEQIPQTFLGLDYSMHELYKDSNGNEPVYPGYYRKAEKKLKREQHKLALMQKGLKNRNKQRIRVAKIHEKVANQRRDFLHKQSRQIANAYDCVCIEDLDMKAMAQSMNFGKSVCDNGWGMFTAFLQYKLADMGKRLIKVDKFFASSQICSCCGYRNTATKELDVNAAINIRNEGMRLATA